MVVSAGRGTWRLPAGATAGAAARARRPAAGPTAEAAGSWAGRWADSGPTGGSSAEAGRYPDPDRRPPSGTNGRREGYKQGVGLWDTQRDCERNQTGNLS